MNSPKRKLVIMAKAPRLGSVKTRLAATYSVEAVTELYACLLKDTIAVAQQLDDVETAIMCPESGVGDLSRSVGGAMRIVPQTGRGLAAALTSVFSHFTNSAHERIIAFNSDTPHLPGSVLENAFGLLETYDLVAGPTHDGGYYLVGAKSCYHSLFASDGMGTGSALGILSARAEALGLSMALTDRFYDIDIAADLQQLASELARVPDRAPRTAKWLMEWASERRD